MIPLSDVRAQNGTNTVRKRTTNQAGQVTGKCDALYSLKDKKDSNFARCLLIILLWVYDMITALPSSLSFDKKNLEKGTIVIRADVQLPTSSRYTREIVAVLNDFREGWTL